MNKNLKTGARVKKERTKKLIEKMQENGPGRKRDSETRQDKADKEDRKRKLLALNFPESGGAISTERIPGIPHGEENVQQLTQGANH